MKRCLTTLLMAMLILGGTSAMAVTQDVPLTTIWATFDAGDFNFAGYDALFPDLDQNGIDELAELALLQAFLADDTIPGQAAVMGAFAHNLAAAQPLIDAFVNFGFDLQTEVMPLALTLVGLTTMGGNGKVTFLSAYLNDQSALALGLWNSAVVPNLWIGTATGSVWSVFDAAGDLDGDLVTNADEFAAAGGDPAAYVYQVLTAGAVDLSVVVSGAGKVEVGGTRTLTAVVTGGTSPFTYQWTKDSADISGATAATYTVAPDALDDAGVYGVRVTDNDGAIASGSADVEVLPEGSLPVAGFAALGLLVTLCAGVGARKAMK